MTTNGIPNVFRYHVDNGLFQLGRGYGLEVSPDLISRVTDAVLDEVNEWRSRALDAVYPVVIFDALRVKIRDIGTGPWPLGAA